MASTLLMSKPTIKRPKERNYKEKVCEYVKYSHAFFSTIKLAVQNLPDLDVSTEFIPTALLGTGSFTATET